MEKSSLNVLLNIFFHVPQRKEVSFWGELCLYMGTSHRKGLGESVKCESMIPCLKLLDSKANCQDKSVVSSVGTASAVIRARDP